MEFRHLPPLTGNAGRRQVVTMVGRAGFRRTDWQQRHLVARRIEHELGFAFVIDVPHLGRNLARLLAQHAGKMACTPMAVMLLGVSDAPVHFLIALAVADDLPRGTIGDYLAHPDWRTVCYQHHLDRTGAGKNARRLGRSRRLFHFLSYFILDTPDCLAYLKLIWLLARLYGALYAQHTVVAAFC